MTPFLIIAVVLTLATTALVTWPLLRSRESPVAAVIAALGIPAAALLTYSFVSNYQWSSAEARAPSTANSAVGTMEEAIASLERTLASDPSNEEGWILLGSSYLSTDRPADALTAYRRALEVSGGRSVAALLGTAEARIVLDPGALQGEAGADIEQVLQSEPRNPKALWYGGLRAMALDQPEAAKNRWSTLLELQPPERVREIIERQLAQLDQGAPMSNSGVTARAADAPAAQTNESNTEAAIQVAVSLSDQMRGRVSSSAPVFIFLRENAAGGPPLAVVRRQASELPLTVSIREADVMLPGRTLAGLESAALVARVANSGDPVARIGDVFGEARWDRSGPSDGPVTLVIDRLVDQSR